MCSRAPTRCLFSASNGSKRRWQQSTTFHQHRTLLRHQSRTGHCQKQAPVANYGQAQRQGQAYRLQSWSCSCEQCQKGISAQQQELPVWLIIAYVAVLLFCSAGHQKHWLRQAQTHNRCRRWRHKHAECHRKQRLDRAADHGMVICTSVCLINLEQFCLWVYTCR